MSDLDQVVAAMRAAGWRSSDERLLSTAAKRLRTAQYHRARAAANREAIRTLEDQLPEYRRWFLNNALRHEVRAAERSGQVSRGARDVALKLVSTWTGGADDLLRTAEAIAVESVAAERPPAACAIPAVSRPPSRMAR